MSTLLLLSLAAAMDLKEGKIRNRLVLAGLAEGLLLQIAEAGWEGAGVFLRNVSIPVILCYLLFLMHALGAGDIKLFSVIGGIWDLHVLKLTIIVSFLVAAGMSLWKMLYYRNLISRLCIFRKYLHQVIVTFQLPEYPKGDQGKQHIIHFSTAILIGFLVALEVAD